MTTPATYPGVVVVPTIQPLSYAGLDYLRSFGVVAVAVSPSGRVFVSRDPKGAAAAWWTKSEFADQIANVAWMNGDVPGAAARLGLTVTAHDTVLRRVAEKTAALDKAIAKAIDAGTLRTFNRTYRERRLAAKRDGKPFMPYSQALAKLRAVIADSVARGEIPKSFASVFDEARPSP